MPETKRPWRNMLADLVEKALVAAKDSPTIAHALANTPTAMALTAMAMFDKDLRLTWTGPVGFMLLSPNSNAWNALMYHYAQTNELADAEAEILKGYAQLVTAAARVLPDTTKITVQQLKERGLTERKALK